MKPPNHIDGTDACANQRNASIDYRACRKGAPQFFHEQCRS